MIDERFESISAFIDGEACDVAEVIARLEEPEGQRLLVDLLRLRQAARARRTEHARGVPADTRPGARPGVAVGGPSTRRAVAPLPLAAAALLAAIVGFGIGLVTPRQPDGLAPPAASRTVRLVPGVDWTVSP